MCVQWIFIYLIPCDLKRQQYVIPAYQPLISWSWRFLCSTVFRVLDTRNDFESFESLMFTLSLSFFYLYSHSVHTLFLKKKRFLFSNPNKVVALRILYHIFFSPFTQRFHFWIYFFLFCFVAIVRLFCVIFGIENILWICVHLK